MSFLSKLTGLFNRAKSEPAHGPEQEATPGQAMTFAAAADQAMAAATANARKSFNIFWREMSWEIRRTVPAFGIAVVKRGFATNIAGAPIEVEHMWLNEIEFDGVTLRGKLMNQPNFVQGLNEGDSVAFPWQELDDWMYSLNDRVYGAFTVNALRQGLSAEDRQNHDEAWGLDFGNPAEVEVGPNFSFARFCTMTPETLPDSGLVEPSAEMIEEGMRQIGDHINEPIFNGLTMLQFEALAGNLVSVNAMIRHGVDKHVRNPNGHTALDLATKMGWGKVAAALR